MNTLQKYLTILAILVVITGLCCMQAAMACTPPSPPQPPCCSGCGGCFTCVACSCVFNCSDWCCGGGCYSHVDTPFEAAKQCCPGVGTVYLCNASDGSEYVEYFWDREKCKPGGGCTDCFYHVTSYDQLRNWAYTCEHDGFDIVSNPRSTLKPDGCSTLTGDNPAGIPFCGAASDFGADCNIHDSCYETCGSNKATCDSIFGDAMDITCTGTNPLCYIDCEAWRIIYWAAVDLVGEDAYEADQKEACALNKCYRCGVNKY
jgi:hypothetical protein